MSEPGILLPGTGFSLGRWLPNTSPSARVWNQVDGERASLGATFRVARVTQLGNHNPPNFDSLIGAWQTASGTGGIVTSSIPSLTAVGSGGPVRIAKRGSYLLLAQVRFPAVGTLPGYGDGSNVGWRKCRILLNGTSAPQHTIASSPPIPGSATGAGVTCQAFGVRTLRPGDVLYVGYKHSSNAEVPIGTADRGGTFLSITYMGPGAPS